MRYILTQPITLVPGTVFELTDELGEGGLEALIDRGCMRIFMGRAAGLREGILRVVPDLRLVDGPGGPNPA